MNKENPRAVIGDEIPNQAITSKISKEVKKALKTIKNNKVIGQDSIPFEEWKVLRQKNANML